MVLIRVRSDSWRALWVTPKIALMITPSVILSMRGSNSNGSCNGQSATSCSADLLGEPVIALQPLGPWKTGVSSLRISACSRSSRMITERAPMTGLPVLEPVCNTVGSAVNICSTSLGSETTTKLVPPISRSVQTSPCS